MSVDDRLDVHHRILVDRNQSVQAEHTLSVRHDGSTNLEEMIDLNNCCLSIRRKFVQPGTVRFVIGFFLFEVGEELNCCEKS